MFGKQDAETAPEAQGAVRGKLTLAGCRVTVCVGIDGRRLLVAGSGGPGMPARGYSVPLPLLGKVMAVSSEGPSLLMENGDLLVWRPENPTDPRRGQWKKEYNLLDVAEGS